ncbi:MAG: hypothetical protein QOJ54_2171 [Aliidongia sp.]|nr:hypothetical protein [Aliidongia sp.]
MIFYSPAKRAAYMAHMGDLDLTPKLAEFTGFPTLVLSGRYDVL